MGWVIRLYLCTSHLHLNVFSGRNEMFTAERFPSQYTGNHFQKPSHCFPTDSFPLHLWLTPRSHVLQGFVSPRIQGKRFIQVVLDPWEALTAAQTKASPHRSQGFALSLPWTQRIPHPGRFCFLSAASAEPTAGSELEKAAFSKVVKEPLLGKDQVF